MRAARGREAQRGSITPMIFFIALSLGMLMLGAAAIGRVTAAKVDAQQIADAAAMAAVDAVREEGRNTGTNGAYETGRKNARTAGNNTVVTVQRTLQEIGGAGTAVGHMVATATATVTIDVPPFLFGDDRQVTAQATAKADIEQERRTIADSQTPRVMLVLDYSGSMAGQAIEIQEDAVTEHLLGGEDIPEFDFGAVLFDDAIINSVNFENQVADPLPEDQPTVVETILEFFNQYTADGGTGTGGALDEATNLMGGMNERPQYVIVASDGGPNDPQGARDAADRLWDTTQATIMALHVNLAADAAAEEFMKYISGTYDNRHDENFYFPVSDLDEFQDALAQIISTIACAVDPLDENALKDPTSVRVFLEGAGGEIKLEPVADLGESAGELGYQFNAENRRLFFTNAACSMVREQGYRILARYNRGELIP